MSAPAKPPVTDDAVREVHGCRTISSKKEVILIEHDDFVLVQIGLTEAHLTQWQMRYLASKLYRISRRIRTRKVGEV